MKSTSGHSVVCKPGLLRLILATCVLVSHVSKLQVGRISVLVFFFLSGFWVLDVWKARFGPGRVAPFYVSRYLRIAPVYFVALFLTLTLTGSRVHPLSLSIVGASNMPDDPLWVTWSLDIELQFYLLMPLLVWVMARGFRVFFLLVLASALCGWLLFYDFKIFDLLQYLPVFALGMVVRECRWDPGRTGAVASLVVFAGTTLVFGLCGTTTFFLYKDQAYPIHRDIVAFVWMLPLLPYVAHSLTLRSDAFDRHLGNLSYPLYVIHPFVLTIFHDLAPQKSLPVKVAAFVTPFVAALVLYVLVDRPLERARRKIERIAKTGVEPPVLATAKLVED